MNFNLKEAIKSSLLLLFIIGYMNIAIYMLFNCDKYSNTTNALVLLLLISPIFILLGLERK